MKGLAFIFILSLKEDQEPELAEAFKRVDKMKDKPRPSRAGRSSENKVSPRESEEIYIALEKGEF
ncbi:hypothetical protein D1867_06920 [Acidianus infernus]|uniref:Uncharacterized protein n=1 Tax=Acidianus infernus TaxID=12915 RepID=A0A6A9QFC7_ACIIN|nr:hypothetical protein [Acidianus infernus]MUM64975.1 hypothetical protein [Acidianus infernus]